MAEDEKPAITGTIKADTALYIAEEAFRAGFRAALAIVAVNGRSWAANCETSAWNEFEPSEDAKALTS